MKHGDISNQCSFNIGFRCENLLLTPRKGVKDILLNAVSGKWANAEVDKEVLKTMYDIYWNTEYTIWGVLRVNTAMTGLYLPITVPTMIFPNTV